MNLKQFKPITSSQRHRKILSRTPLTTAIPFKPLVKFLKNDAGRNFRGKITVRHQGGGLKNKYRLISFNRKPNGVYKLLTVEYDPFRHCFISLTKELSKNIFEYILLPEGLKKGDIIETNNKADIKIGNTLELSQIPLGTYVHNVELIPYKGGQLARSAGSYAQIIKKDIGKYVILKLKSGQEYSVLSNCRATIGTVGCSQYIHTNKGKAGINRLLGKRPTVRGVAMNPVDHPHGGGEGRTSGGRPSVSPWGILTKGKPTVKNKLIKKRLKMRY